MRARVLGQTSSGTIQATFNAKALAGAADTVYAVSGDSQTALVGTTVADPLVVQVTDQFGNPLSNQVIGWSAEDGGS